MLHYVAKVAFVQLVLVVVDVKIQVDDAAEVLDLLVDVDQLFVLVKLQDNAEIIDQECLELSSLLHFLQRLGQRPDMAFNLFSNKLNPIILK